jgi:RNA polymerase sigma factor (TIGR02999 family)
MGSQALESVTFWLSQWHDGAEGALEQLTHLVYEDLRRLAAHYLQDEHSAPTFQATALVHELYLRISSVRDIEWQGRGQFIAVAAQIMRRILIDHARKRQRVKRDPGVAIPFEEAIAPPDFDVLVVDQALQRMTASFPRHAQIVELRFFGGLESPEIAEALGISLRTVERDWRFAKAWLQNEVAK